ncbi:MAG: SH3 domain-containing protein [Kangiellaceae bacterium]|nr:SH3 domain-containing protein [Kangiellaceae bacterium]MCW9000105.1 SH3 domain-containing protein [Kangiellaceae bacterium]MCW9016299.1 SH3 domain-containing protein [Kangiellaceae bacterium]
MNYRILRRLGVGIIAFGACYASLLMATPAKVVRDSSLKEKPSFKATDVGQLAKNQDVEILQRQRGWYKISTQPTEQGWVTLLQVRFEASLSKSGSSDLSKFVSLRQGHSGVTATTGVRGIGEKDIKNAKANFVALERAKQFKVTPQDAQFFAKQAALRSQTITYKKKEGK